MKKRRLPKRLVLILLLPLAIFISNISSSYPELVENIYSRVIYKPIGRILSSITGIFPFSLAELLVFSLALFSVCCLVSIIFKLIKRVPDSKRSLFNFLGNILAAVSITHFAFIALWGINYNRLPFSKTAGLNVKPASVKELEAVSISLIGLANKLRNTVNESPSGTMELSSTLSDAFKRAPAGYENASSVYPELGGSYGLPKGVKMSFAMSYAGISGVYFPFTSEANVNIDVPRSMLPSTIAHEMAHQRGFAREDEANYIAYLTCRMHPDSDFQYSGILLALINSMNALYGYDQDKYFELRKTYSAGVNKDLSELSAFWRKYEGPVEKISTRINDTYLKANKQNDGVYSYGRMVDLLIAEYRAGR